MLGLQLNENWETWFSTHVWEKMITNGIQGETSLKTKAIFTWFMITTQHWFTPWVIFAIDQLDKCLSKSQVLKTHKWNHTKNKFLSNWSKTNHFFKPSIFKQFVTIISMN
jgi:hypothetical protein